jgi:PAS domain S-box-containing protein
MENSVPLTREPDFQALFESAPGLYLVLTPDLTIVAVSDAYLRATMTQREQILGKGIFDVFPDNPSDPSADGVRNLRASLESVLRNGIADAMPMQKYDIRKPANEGGNFEERYWRPFNLPVFGPRKEVTYIIHRVEDVTEFVRLKQQRIDQQKHTEELRARTKQMESEATSRAREVLETNQRLEAAKQNSANLAIQSAQARQELDSFFNLSLDLLCIAGTDGFFKRLNPAWEKKLGYSIKELLAAPFFEFMHPDDRQSSAREVEKLKEMRNTVDFENRFRCKDGSYRWISWNATPSLEKGLIYAVGRDITQLEQTERSLRQSEEHSRLIIESVVDYAILTLDQHGTVTSWNAGAERIKGYRAEEILGRHFSQFYPAADVQAGKPQHELEVAAAEGRLLDEGWRVRKDGSTFWAHVAITALRDEAGTLLGFAKVTRDMTAHKRAQEQLLVAKEEAERSNRFKDQFLSTMSHELRTPLNAVLGFSDLLSEESYGPLNERQARYVNHINKGGHHLLRLINDILDLSKIEAGRLQLAIENVPVNRTFAEVFDTLRPLAEKKSQKFVLSASANLNVMADTTRFKQILLNLIGNSVKFTPDGGKIELDARKVDQTVRIEVRDSGPGIPLEEQRRIFEAFYRLTQTDKAAEGTGLGLAITQRLVELHGGKLGLDSQPGAGSCFYFTLPLAPTFEACEPAAAKGRTKSLASGRILVIEDDLTAAHLLQSQLTSAGYEVILSGAQNALEMAASLCPAAITTDIVMKPISGWELLSNLKSDARTSAIPVIVITMVDQRATGALLGADEYIVKPVKKETLLVSLDRCLSRRERPEKNRPILVVEDHTPTREFISEVLSQHGYTVRSAADGPSARTQVAALLPELVILDLILPGISGFQLLNEWRRDSRTNDLPVFILTSKDLTTEEKEYLNANARAVFRKQDSWQENLLR